MNHLPLSRGLFAVVDDEDFERVSQHKWYAIPGANTFYAVRNRRIPESGLIYLHRELLNAPDDLDVDHEDGNGLNCRRYNLRLATRSLNLANRSYTSNATGFRGVQRMARDGKWRARVMVNGTFRRGPYRSTAIEAAQDADAIIRDNFGQFGSFNFPRDGERAIAPIRPTSSEVLG